MGIFGPPNFERLKKWKSVKGLTRVLRDPNPDLRKKAAEAIGELSYFLGFPKAKWPNESNNLPKLWPTLVVTSKDAHKYIETNEEILGMIQVQWKISSKYNFPSGYPDNPATVSLEGREREYLSQLANTMTPVVSILEGEYIEGVYNPRRDMVLAITDKRFLFVERYRETFSKIKLGAVYSHRSLHKAMFSQDSDLLTLEFTDGSHLCFEFACGLFSKKKKIDWVEEWNKYLHLYYPDQSKEYLGFLRAVSRGGEVVVQALEERLYEQDTEVRTAVIEALKSIGGPKALQLVAQYDALKK